MALGRGLGSLIPTKSSVSQPLPEQPAGPAILLIPVHQITVNPHQPRQQFSHQELENLIQSIRQHGILQPLLVSQTQPDQYELIAGERRWRAAKMAGLSTVPAILRTVDDADKVELALIENIQRSDLNAVEKATGYHKLLEQFGLSHEAAAKKLGISRPSFSNTLRILELPTELQTALADGKLTEGHAKVLLGLTNPAEQLKYWRLIQTDQLSVHRLSQVVSGKTKQHRQASAVPSSQHAAWQEELALALGTRVIIQPRQIVIEYYSAEELAQLVKKLTR